MVTPVKGLAMMSTRDSIKGVMIAEMRNIHRQYSHRTYHHIDFVELHPELFEEVIMEFASDRMGYIQTIDPSVSPPLYTLCGTEVRSGNPYGFSGRNNCFVVVIDPLTKRETVFNHELNLALDVTIKFKRLVPSSTVIKQGSISINMIEPVPRGPTYEEILRAAYATDRKVFR